MSADEVNSLLRALHSFFCVSYLLEVISFDHAESAYNVAVFPSHRRHVVIVRNIRLCSSLTTVVFCGLICDTE